MPCEESAIISAYTGFLTGPFDAMHEYVEKLIGTPVWTHQFADKDFYSLIKEKSKADFIRLAESVK